MLDNERAWACGDSLGVGTDVRARFAFTAHVQKKKENPGQELDSGGLNLCSASPPIVRLLWIGAVACSAQDKRILGALILEPDACSFGCSSGLLNTCHGLIIFLSSLLMLASKHAWGTPLHIFALRICRQKRVFIPRGPEPLPPAACVNCFAAMPHVGLSILYP